MHILQDGCWGILIDYCFGEACEHKYLFSNAGSKVTMRD